VLRCSEVLQQSSRVGQSAPKRDVPTWSAFAPVDDQIGNAARTSVQGQYRSLPLQQLHPLFDYLVSSGEEFGEDLRPYSRFHVSQLIQCLGPFGNCRNGHTLNLGQIKAEMFPEQATQSRTIR
jgi:hypothetical protein